MEAHFYCHSYAGHSIQRKGTKVIPIEKVIALIFCRHPLPWSFGVVENNTHQYTHFSNLDNSRFTKIEKSGLMQIWHYCKSGLGGVENSFCEVVQIYKISDLDLSRFDEIMKSGLVQIWHFCKSGLALDRVKTFLYFFYGFCKKSCRALYRS